MKTIINFFGALVILIAIMSCKESSTTANNDEADKAAITDVIKKHLDAVDALDVPTILRCMVEDHVEMPPNTLKIVGKQPYADYFSTFAEFFKTLKDKEMSFIPDELIVSGNWAFQIGTYNTKFKLQDDNIIEDSGNYVWIFKKENDGTWKWARVISNSTKPAQSS
jgi:ketosteroid isomerase-like protein